MATQLADTQPQEVETTEQSQSRDYVAEAREIGWLPLEEFKGDPSKHVDAETFVRRGEEVLPLVKKQNATLRREIDDLKKLVKRLEKSEQNAYNAALADLRAKQEEAVETGDLDQFRETSKKIDALKEDIREEVGLVKGEDPIEQEELFIEANPWYAKGALASASEVEVLARLFADRTARKWAREGLADTMAPSEFFAKVAEVTEREFPQLKAKSPRVKPPSDVAGVTAAGSGSKAKTGANLPLDAKAQAKRFYEQGVYKKAKSLTEALDIYAKDYDWSN